MSSPAQPCVSCGEETAAGTPLYSDRRVSSAANSHPFYLCVLCAEQLVTGRLRAPLTDEERRRLESAAALFGGFVPGGH